jgi:hypothetical protein
LKQQLFTHFLEMLPALCRAVPENLVIVRPHPAENHAPWLKLTQSCPNLRIINEDSVTPWLMAAGVLVANGCTTMIESAVLGTPTIAYQPVRDGRYDDDLPNQVSHRAFSRDELCTHVADIMSGRLGVLAEAERRAVLDQHLAALDGALAGERIVDVLAGAGYRAGPAPATSILIRIQGSLHNKIRTLSKRRNMRRPGHRNNIKYHDHRFPGITTAELENKISCLGALLGGRFAGLKVSQLEKHVFRIDPR